MRREPTQEQKQAAQENRARFRELWRNIAKLSDAEREAMAARLPLVTCEGHALSPHNCCIVLAQSDGKPMPTVVGGFQQWRRMGRCVVKGEHGYMILVPSSKKRNDEITEPRDNTDMRFLTVYVFDITQTQEETHQEIPPIE